MPNNEQLATQDHAPSFVKASDRLSLALGIPTDQMISTLKAQCFRGSRPDDITNAQLGAFISIANDMGVNPLLPGMLYAFPDRGAIFPIMGPDGVFKKLSEHPDIDSWETIVYPEDPSLAPTHSTTKIWRKGRERPVSYTALLSEWKVGSNPNWNSRPRHMLSIRSLKQAARQIIHGLPGDEDDRVLAEINVTPQQPDRPPPPPKAKKGAAAVVENKSVETIATPVVEPESSRPTPVPEPTNIAPSEPKVIEAKAEVVEPKKEPFTTLADNQRVFVNVRIDSFIGKKLNVAGKMVPSIKAAITGGFVGEVYHLGGAAEQGDQIICPKEWQLDRPVVIELLGVMNRGSGRIIPQVQSIKEASGDTADEF